MVVIRQVYDWVESALWAGLVAFVIYFLVNVVPNLPEMTRHAVSMRALKIAAENRSYCEKWGMKQGTHEHARCTVDLQELRTRIARDLSDEGVF
jgi:signal transduction histidine kinase